MTERQQKIEDARADAAECELICNLAVDPETRRTYRKRAESFRRAAKTLQQPQD